MTNPVGHGNRPGSVSEPVFEPVFEPVSEPVFVPEPFREAVISTDAIRHNIASIVTRVSPARVMAVVKANGYGHDPFIAARAALEGGASALGVADVTEALALRKAGVTVPVLAWLHDPDADFVSALAANIEIAVSSRAQLGAVVEAAAALSRVAAIHVKVDTGLSRNGVAFADLPALCEAVRAAHNAGRVVLKGIMSHLANTSSDEDAAQRDIFVRAVELVRAAGLNPGLRHLAASSAVFTTPAAWFDMVRVGIAGYGVSPFAATVTPAELGLRPAMTLRGRVIAVHRLPAGVGVSYNHTWRPDRETTVALIPFGYADGLPRQASNRGEVWLAGGRRPVVGRIAMDQCVVDVGNAPVAAGDEVVLFGDPGTGVPSAEDWAVAADTIGYDIVTRIGPRVPRRALGVT